MNFNKLFLIIACCLYVLAPSVGRANVIKVDKFGLHTDAKFFTEDRDYDKTKVKNDLPDEIYNRLENNLIYISFNEDAAIEKQIKNCQKKLSKLWKSYNREVKKAGLTVNYADFEKLTSDSLHACKGVFTKLAPKLYFDLEADINSQNRKFKLKNIQTETVYVWKKLSGGGNYKNNVLHDMKLSSVQGVLDNDIKEQFILEGLGRYNFKLWSQFYDATKIGAKLPRTNFLVRIKFEFEEVGTDESFEAATQLFLIEI